MTKSSQAEARHGIQRALRGLNLTSSDPRLELVVFFFGVLAFYVFTYWRFFYVGMLNYVDLTPVHLSASEQLDGFRASWVNQNLGSPGSELPGNVLTSLLTLTLGNPVSAQKFLYLSLMPLSSITMFLYLRSHLRSAVLRAIVSFYYGVNPITIMLFDGGSGLLIPYAAYPIFVWSLERMLISHRRISDAVTTSVVVSLPSFFNPQTPMFYLPTFLVFLIITTGQRNLGRASRLLACSLGIFVAITVAMYSSLWNSFVQILVSHSNEIAYSAAGVQLDSISSRIVGDFLTPVAERNMITFIGPLAALSVAGLRVRSKVRLEYFAFLLIPTSFLALWWSGFNGYSIWLYTLFPPLAVYGVVKMLAILTESFFLLGLFLIRKAPNRVGSVLKRRIPKISILGLVLVMIIASNLAYQVNPDDPKFSAFTVGGADRTRYSVPQVYYEVRNWLSLDSSQGLARILWLPMDPGTLNIVNAFYPYTPVYFPDTNQAQRIFDIITAERANGIGALLADVNVKYVIVNMVPNKGGAIWEHDDSPHLGGYGPAFSFSLYMAGRPFDYAQLLRQASDLRPVIVRDDFIAFENSRYVPTLAAFPRVTFIAPPNDIQQLPGIEPNNSTNNLLSNADFGKGLDGWKIAGTWVVKDTVSSGNYTHYAVASQLQGGWVMAWRSIAARNTSYYLSGSMATTNVVQSHVRVTYYDSVGQRLRTDFPQSGVDGTHDGKEFRAILLPPQGATNITLWLMGGWSQDGIHPGETSFNRIYLSETFGPISDSPRSEISPALAISGLSDIPNENYGKVITGTSWQEFARNLPQDTLRLTQKIFFGSASNNIDTTNSVPLTYVYEAESSLRPVQGKWEINLDANYSNGAALNGVIYPITAELSFPAIRSGQYLIQFKASSLANWNLTVDGSPIGVESQESNTKMTASLSWFEANTSLFLAEGNHLIRLSSRAKFVLDKIVIRTDTAIEGGFPKENFLAKMTTSHTYTITLQSSSPVIIVLGMNFNAQWQAVHGSNQLIHFPLALAEYSANAYYWAGGQTIITIYFAGQTIRDLLLVISGTSLLISLVVVIFPALRRLGIKRRNLFA